MAVALFSQNLQQLHRGGTSSSSPNFETSPVVVMPRRSPILESSPAAVVPHLGSVYASLSDSN